MATTVSEYDDMPELEPCSYPVPSLPTQTVVSGTLWKPESAFNYMGGVGKSTDILNHAEALEWRNKNGGWHPSLIFRFESESEKTTTVTKQ